MGLRRVYRADADCRVRLDVSRLRSRSWGLFGGQPGGHGGIVCGPGVVFERDSAELTAGQWFEVITPGAAGYGPPAARDAVAGAPGPAAAALSRPPPRHGI